MKSARTGPARRDDKMGRRRDMTSPQRRTLKQILNAKRRWRDKRAED